MAHKHRDSARCQEAVIGSKVAEVDPGEEFFLEVKIPLHPAMIRISGMLMRNCL